MTGLPSVHLYSHTFILSSPLSSTYSIILCLSLPSLLRHLFPYIHPQLSVFPHIIKPLISYCCSNIHFYNISCSLRYTQQYSCGILFLNMVIKIKDDKNINNYFDIFIVNFLLITVWYWHIVTKQFYWQQMITELSPWSYTLFLLSFPVGLFLPASNWIFSLMNIFLCNKSNCNMMV